jgi:hypothetical protein
VDDVRDPVVGERVANRLRLGDVPLDGGDAVELPRLGDQVQPALIEAEVDRGDRCALAGERGDGPRAEAPERARDQPALRRLRRQ